MRALRILLRSVIVVAALLPLLVLLLYGLLRSGVLTGSLDQAVTMLARKEGVFFVRAEGLSGDPPEHLRARKIEIGDYYGVWLTIEDVEADWHPADLFHPLDHVKWRVNVDRAHAARVVWTRLPKDGPDEVDEPFHWDRFIRIVVGHLLVDDFELSGELLGGAKARVRAEGSGVLGEWDHGFVKLDLEHVDDVAGKARIDLATGGAPLALWGTVQAEEGAGGALAALARLDDAGAITLDLKASGAMRDWKGEVDVTASNIGVLRAATKLSFNAQGPFEVTGTFDPVSEQRQRWLVGEGGPIALAAKGAWAPDVELRLDRVTLVADGRQLTADGHLDLATHEFRVGANLVRPGDDAPVVLTIVDVKSARLDGHGVLGDGGFADATLDLATPALAGVSGSSLHAVFAAKDAPGDSVPTFQLTADATGLVQGEGPLPLFGDAAQLVASGRIDLLEGVLAADKLSVEGGALRIEGPLAFTDKWKVMRGSWKADATDLASLTRVFGTSVAGTASATMELTATTSWDDIDAKLDVNAAGVAVGESGWNALIGPTATLGAVFRGAAGGASHGEVVLKTIGIDADARLDVGADGKALEADARLSLDNLSRLAEPTRAAIAGRLKASATAKGTLDRFDAKATMQGDRFSFEGLRFDSLTADVDAAGLPHAWTAKVRSRGSYGKQNAALDAVVSMPSAGQLRIRDLVLSGPRTQGSADLDVDLHTAAASGTIALKSEDLSAWRAMTGVAIEGAVSVDAKLATTPGGPGGAAASQQVSGSATIRSGALDVAGNRLTIDKLEITAESIETGPRPRGGAKFQASKARYGATTLVDGLLTASGDGRLWNLATTFDLRGAQDLSLEAAATVTPAAPFDVALSRATGSVGGVAVELREPATLRVDRIDAAAWSLSAVTLGVGKGGVVTGQASSKGNALHVEAEVSALPLDVVMLFAPALDLEGSIDGKVTYDGASLASATGQLSLRGRNVTGAGLEHEGEGALDLQAELQLGKGRVSGSASVDGLADTRFELALNAPVVSASAADPVVIDLTWKGELGGVAALLPFGEDSLTGRIDAALRLSGTVASPRVTGRAVVDGGSWQNAATGLVLRDIHAELEGSGAELQLRTLTATDGEEGRVTARGDVRFEGFPAFEMDFDLEASDAMLSRLDLITTKADARLVLKASRGAGEDAAMEGAITGSVRIDDVRVEIPQRFVSDVPELVVIEVDSDPAATVVERRVAHPLALALDIAVVGDNRIYVTGRGVESEWASDVHLRGDTSDVRAEGVVTSVRGQLSLLGRRFDVDSATLRFNGEKGNVPQLQMTARADANDITAIAVVSGPATNPTIELRSEPALPRDEVLSRVLFGQSAANLTPMQSVQLARSIAELTGSPLGGGSGLVSGIGRSLGFDRLDIESAGSEGGAALTASKYLTDNVYLRVQQGLTPETSKISIEWRIMKHLTIESDVSQDAQGEVGATWRWDY